MSEPTPTLETALESLLRRIVREEIQFLQDGKASELLTPEELAAALKVPLSWVYEQSRQGNIPTHRIGRYIRFDREEVLECQKKKELVSPSLTPVK
jgi:excisionase family DNA binding protein